MTGTRGVLAQKMKLDLAKSLQLLEAAGYTAANESVTLAQLGKRHAVAPQTLYLAIEAAATELPEETSGVAALPVSAPPGTGNVSLADLSARYSLNLKEIERALKKKGLMVSAELTLKQIAAQNQTSATDVYADIREFAGR